MTHGSLFSGIGGFDLAAYWAGIPTLWQVEKDAYCRAVLRKHFPEAKQYERIEEVYGTVAQSECKQLRTERYGSTDEASDGMQRETQERKRIRNDVGQCGEDSNSNNRIHTLAPVDIISGGFPCQPFSVAGKQRGKEDDRYLWPEMLRVIAEVRPAWVIAENVAGIIRMELDNCIASLEAEGYTAWPVIIPACAVNAPHRRDRVWIICYSKHNGRATAEVRRGTQSRNDGGTTWKEQSCKPSGSNQQYENVGYAKKFAWNERQTAESSEYQKYEIKTRRPSSCENVAHADTARFGERWWAKSVQQTQYPAEYCGQDACGATRMGLQNGAGITVGESREVAQPERSDWWAVEPNVGRVAHGIPARVDRLKSLGNAIVPQVAYQIFKAIKEVSL